MFERLACIAASFLLLCASPAQATDYRVDFQISGFWPSSIGGPPAPFPLVSGFAIVTADWPKTMWDEIKDFSFTVGSAQFSADNVEVRYLGHSIAIGGVDDGIFSMRELNNDFMLFLYPDLTATVMYATPEGEGLFSGANGTVTYTRLPVLPVPEPEAYAMLLAGLGLLSVAARRRRKA